MLLGALIFLFISQNIFASFFSVPSIEDATANSKLVLRVTVIEDSKQFEVGGEAVFQLFRCKVIATLKSPKNTLEGRLVDFGELHLACPASKRFGTLKKGGDYIVFCVSGGFAPTVLNGGYFYEIQDGKVSVPERLIPDGEPSSKANRSMKVEVFSNIVARLVASTLSE